MKAFNIVFIISVIILSSVALAAVGDITFCPDINGDGTVNDPDISERTLADTMENENNSKIR